MVALFFLVLLAAKLLAIGAVSFFGPSIALFIIPAAYATAVIVERRAHRPR